MAVVEEASKSQRPSRNKRKGITASEATAEEEETMELIRAAAAADGRMESMAVEVAEAWTRAAVKGERRNPRPTEEEEKAKRREKAQLLRDGNVNERKCLKAVEIRVMAEAGTMG